MNMKQSRKYGILIGLSKPVSKPKHKTSLPSPRDKFAKQPHPSYPFQSPKKDVPEFLLLKKKVLNKSKQSKIQSGYLSFANNPLPLNSNNDIINNKIKKKDYIGLNTTNKSKILMQSVDNSLIHNNISSSNKDISTNINVSSNKILNSFRDKKMITNNQLIGNIINGSSNLNGMNSNKQISFNSRKNSCDNINSFNLKKCQQVGSQKNQTSYNKYLIEKITKDNVKKFIYFSGAMSNSNSNLGQGQGLIDTHCQSKKEINTSLNINNCKKVMMNNYMSQYSNNNLNKKSNLNNYQFCSNKLKGFNSSKFIQHNFSTCNRSNNNDYKTVSQKSLSKHKKLFENSNSNLNSNIFYKKFNIDLNKNLRKNKNYKSKSINIDENEMKNYSSINSQFNSNPESPNIINNLNHINNINQNNQSLINKASKNSCKNIYNVMNRKFLSLNPTSNSKSKGKNTQKENSISMNMKMNALHNHKENIVKENNVATSSTDNNNNNFTYIHNNSNNISSINNISNINNFNNLNNPFSQNQFKPKTSKNSKNNSKTNLFYNNNISNNSNKNKCYLNRIHSVISHSKNEIKKIRENFIKYFSSNSTSHSKDKKVKITSSSNINNKNLSVTNNNSTSNNLSINNNINNFNINEKGINYNININSIKHNNKKIFNRIYYKNIQSNKNVQNDINENLKKLISKNKNKIKNKNTDQSNDINTISNNSNQEQDQEISIQDNINNISSNKQHKKKEQKINCVNKISNINIQTLQLNLLNNNESLNNNVVIPSSRNVTKRGNDDPSIMMTASSYVHDSNYYLQQSEKLTNYLIKYYQENKNYPPTNLNFYKYGRNIGCGAFGKVIIGLNVLSGRIVAIKSFNKQNMNDNEDNKKKIMYETNLMKRLNHRSIVKILETFESDKYFLIIMEYINGGNLYNFVKKRRKLTEKTAKFLFWQIIEGIKYMHSMNIVHRDIKLENILIDLKNNIKICDFGIGKILQHKNQILYEQCGTPVYIAPEILLANKDHGYEAFPVDLWSAGIALYIMLSGTLPFQLDNLENKNNENLSDNQKKKLYNQELQYAIVNKDIKPIENVSEEAKDLIKGLLNKNPRLRYTSTQVLNHDWFKDENFISNPEKYHLFTKAEMIMLSKTYVDYRYAKNEDLKENFTISNLNYDNNATNNANNNNITKSLILAPYNSMLSEESFFDYLNENIEMNNLSIDNDIVCFSNKVREFNMNYELNNNGELDNGILINSQFDSDNNVSNASSLSINEQYNKKEPKKLNKNSKSANNLYGRDGRKYCKENIINKVVSLGYDKKYLEKCLRNNELCHATAVFYLLENYEDIE